MKEMVKVGSILPIFLIITTLGLLGMTPALATEVQPQEEIVSRIIDALEAGNEDLLRALVEENRYKLYSLICELLDTYVREELDGNSATAQDKQQKAASLAGVYKEIFGLDDLLKRVKLYQGWSREEKEKKIEADGWMSEGKAARGKSEFQTALEKFSAAFELYKALSDWVGEGQALNNTGIILFSLGQYQKAVEYFEQSLNICKEIGEREGEGTAVNGIGAVYFGQGQYRKALRYFQQSLNICREVGNRKGEGKASNNIGIIYSNLGQYRKAMEYHHQAFNIRYEIGDRRGEGISLQSIASIYDALGQYQKAIEYQEQAITIFKEIGDKRRHGKALNNTGDIYLDLGEYEKALAYLEDALTLRREVGDRKGEDISLNSIGYISGILGQYEKAKGCLKQSLNICREIGDRRGEGFNLLDLGSVYSGLGQYQVALQHSRDGLEIALSIGVPEVIWPGQMRLGSIFERLDQTDSALVYYARSIATIESMREELDIGSMKTHFLTNKIPTYHAMVDLLAREKRYEEAYHYAERAKARALLDLLSLGRIDITEGISLELMNKKRDVEERLNAIQQQLSKEYSMSQSEHDSTRTDTLEDDLAGLRLEHEEILRTIELNHPQYATLTGVKQPLTLEEVQERVLDEGAVLIEYLVGEESTIAWVVKKDALHCEKIAITEAEVNSLVKQWRRPFRDVKEGYIDNLADVGFNIDVSNELYQHLFRPIERYVKEEDFLVVVPDGILHYLPFEALVTKIEKKDRDERIIFSEYEQVEYLVEKYAISYAPSASTLDPELKKLTGETDRKGKLLAFGNPDFGRGKGEGKNDFLSLLIRDSKGWVFKPLPKSEEEINEIIRIIKHSEKFLGQEAKEEYLKERAGEFEMIHLATHGILEEKQPMYSRIVLAQDDDPTEDGFLQTFEIFNINLNADLVVLSACETGLGELSRGEGLMGLTRAFMYAGAPSVVVSLWSVEESSSDLMKLFYQNLKDGMGKTEALRQAKIELIRTREKGMSYAHPFLWAPFVLVGEWR